VNLSDEEYFLLDIAERSVMPFSITSDAANLLCQNILLL
jgi:aminopeptidase-like protein